MNLLEQIQRGRFGFCGDEATRFISRYISETTHHGSTSFDDLREAFHTPEDGILLVSPLLLKRIVRVHRQLTNLTFRIPRAQEYLMPTADLLRVVEQIDPTLHRSWGESIREEYSVLLAEPSAEEMAEFAIEHFGLKYWALMAHAETHKRCVSLAGSGAINEATIRKAISRIGVVEFEEIRDVLACDHRLFDPKDNLEVLLEFVAYWVQITNFTPELTRQFFPAIKNPAVVDEMIDDLGIDLPGLLAASEQPYTPSIPQLLRLKDQKEQESEHPLEIHQFEFHARKLTEELRHTLTHSENADTTLERLRPLINSLINRFIDKDRIVRGLTFDDLEWEVLWGDHDCSASDMLLLDQVLSAQLGQLYTRARRADRSTYENDGEKTLARLRSDTRRRAACETTIRQFTSYKQHHEKDPGLIRFQLHELLVWLRFLLYGWINRLLEWSCPRSQLEILLRNRRLKLRMETYWLQAGLYRRRSNPVARLLALRSLLACLEQAGRDHPTPIYDEALAHWRSLVEADIKSFAQLFCTTHRVPEGNEDILLELVSYLVERAEAKQRGRERRLLFDMQSSCEKLVQTYRACDFAGWILAAFRKPLVETLPFQPALTAMKYLSKACDRIRQLKIKKSDQDRYLAPLDGIIQDGVARLRHEIRPLIASAFAQVGMQPADVREQVSFDKLQEELIDTIVQEGRFRFSYLRDAISRNDLRMPDMTLGHLREDPLLSLDTLFRSRLLGVYSRGPIYLRFLQRCSAMIFGTPMGRLATRFMLLPVLTAYVILKGLELSVGVLLHAFTAFQLKLTAAPAMFGVSLFLLALINSHRVRSLSWVALRGIGRAFSLLTRLLRWTLTRPLLAWINGWILAPLLLGTLFAALGLLICQEVSRGFQTANDLPFILTPQAVTTGTGLMIAGYAIAALLLHTYPGRALRDWFNHLVADTAARVKKTLWGGLFGAVMQGFTTMMHTLEHLQYAVENRLRSHTADSRFSFVMKAGLGILWFWISYVVTIYIVLLIEPQVNPIKHFPVVTVSHKMMLPFLKILHDTMLTYTPGFIPGYIAQPLIWITILLLPGLCGFMVWELKENWKLYRANRSDRIQPVVVGSHGETLPRLLRRGFHSGTIPKLLSKVRKSGLAAHDRGDWSKVNKHRHKLRHLEEDLARFTDRELLQNMRRSERFMEPLTSVQCGSILLGTNKIEITILFRDQQGRQFELTLLFEDVFSWIIGSVAFDQSAYDAFWSDDEQKVLDLFLAVFFKKAGVEMVREQVEQTLLSRLGQAYLIPAPNARLAYETTDSRILLAVYDPERNEVLGRLTFNLAHDPVLPELQTSRGKLLGARLSAIPRSALIFSTRTLTWDSVDEVLSSYRSSEPLGSKVPSIARVQQHQFAGIC